MAQKAAKTEETPNLIDQDNFPDPPAGVEVVTPAEEAPCETVESSDPPADNAVGLGRKVLNRDEPFGIICGASSGAAFEQDGVLFDGEGLELA
jgi:hypothetical protein